MTQDYYGTKRITAWRQNQTVEIGDEKTVHEGYAVKYADGYTSWSPKAVFEEAYEPITAMNFGHAFEAIKAGHRVRRPGAYESLGIGKIKSCPWTQICVYGRQDDEPLAAWTPAQIDLFANDWQIVE